MTTSIARLPSLVECSFYTRQNMLALSAPGQGKTTLILQTAAKICAENKGAKLITFDGGTLSPTDTAMSMPDMENMAIQKIIDNRLPNYYDDPEGEGIIYVGEVPLMGTEASKGMQKLWNHEDIGGSKRGEFRIPPGYVFIGDGQRTTDKSGAQRLTRSNASRFVTYELEWDAEHGVDIAKTHYHPKIGAFLTRNPALVDNYDDVFGKERAANDLTLVEGNNGAWASLRSWAKISGLTEYAERSGFTIYSEDIYVRTGSGVGKSYEVFCAMLDKLASMEEIVKNPDKAPVPTRMDEQFALSTMLALTVKGDTFKPISVYQNRYPPELQTVFFKIMNDRLTKQGGPDVGLIRGTTEYKKWITSAHITKLLLGATQS